MCGELESGRTNGNSRKSFMRASSLNARELLKDSRPVAAGQQTGGPRLLYGKAVLRSARPRCARQRGERRGAGATNGWRCSPLCSRGLPVFWPGHLSLGRGPLCASHRGDDAGYAEAEAMDRARDSAIISTATLSSNTTEKRQIMAAEYRLLTYRSDGGRPQAGVLVGERVYPAHTLLAGSRWRRFVVAFSDSAERGAPYAISCVRPPSRSHRSRGLRSRS